MRPLIITLTFFALCLLPGCYREQVLNNKDLDDNMLDIKMYHDNLGLYLRQQDQDNASWILEGMDSTLQVVSRKFTSHRKLRQPLEKSYQKDLQPSLAGIRAALQKGDFEAGKLHYRTLTRKCNGCHKDHDIDKEVLDWSDPAGH